MDKHTLESRQSVLYFAAMALAWLAAQVFSETDGWVSLINPALAIMLFVTFMQVLLVTLLDGLRNLRFIGALLTANFIGIPLLLLLTHQLLPDVPLAQFGILLVLLAPCIDYVVTFCHLGRGDAARLLACTPLLLAMQLLLLPLYRRCSLMPLIGAGLLQHIQSRFLIVQRIANAAGWLPVPATAVVIFLVVASVVPQLELAIGPVRQALLFAAVAAPCIGASTARLFGLNTASRRAVAFSCATRNSLVILPLALSIPGAMPVLPAILVA
ncbi:MULTISPECIES: arsenic resistance protein [Symbiopectobacterium]|uniref:arsenic resistance protein n=1 Tax=Symbiopectobacterium TaxID=801 RepID=UPI001A340E97|nr:MULTISPECIES: arsenic resistance protein [Symbiopectobacterium]MBG6247967.1 arsenic resistance protein [Candidatus Symbiopectobacterium sp. PLON1]